MKYELFPWLILFLPLFSAVAITLFTLRSRTVSAFLSVGAIVTGFVLTIIFISANSFHPAGTEISKNWLTIGNLQIDFGLKLDALSLMMLLIVTGVGGAIHIYSVGYMSEDNGFSRFFAFMSLFTFSMLGIVLANNFIEMFIFWELVGVSSYLLIGFWFEKPSAGDAAKKAFIVNRLGDFGFLLGILAFWSMLGTLNFDSLHSNLIRIENLPRGLGSHWGLSPLQQIFDFSFLSNTTLTIAGLLIFCGAVGKSAQFPLHVWLPDAMEGPTPVSALIHAATMVAAGVYMLCRIFFLLNADALHVIAYIGGFTSLLAALIAVQQNDIKRIIAYSTLSQLGYMVMAVGLSGPTAAMFHLTTHAFFKALLFLSAGSVIIALHHEQDIWKMGNLRKKMPITFWTFLVGALALSGIPPFSGFYSKDSIFAQALEQKSYLLLGVAVIVAGLTAFYIFRLFFVVFSGKEKSDHASHAHESRLVMTLPLVVLAIFAAIGGFIGITNIYGWQFSKVIEIYPPVTMPVTASSFHGPAVRHLVESLSTIQQLTEPLRTPIPMLIGIVVALTGIFLAFSLYKNSTSDPLPAKLGALVTAMKNKFYFDELYEATFVRAHDFIAAVCDWIDRWLVEGFCIGLVRGGTDFTGRALRLVQTGNLQTYAFLFVLGVALVLYFILK